MELCACGTLARAVSSMCTVSRRTSYKGVWTIWLMRISSTTRTQSRPSYPAELGKKLKANLVSTCSQLAETAVYVKLMSCHAILSSCTSKNYQSRAWPKTTKMVSFGTARPRQPSISSRCLRTSTKSVTTSVSNGKSTRRSTASLKPRSQCL